MDNQSSNGGFDEKQAVNNGVDPELFNEFIAEAAEHLECIEVNTLALETEPGSMEIINSLFRSFHTIKGLAGFVEQTLIQEIAHQTETLLDRCRNGKMTAGSHIVNLILQSADHIKRICSDYSLNSNEEFLNSISIHSAMLENPDAAQADKKKIGELLAQKGKISEADILEILIKQKENNNGLMFGQVAVKEKKVGVQDVLEVLRDQGDSRIGKHAVQESGYVRIPTGKLDSLADMVGELIINQSLIEQEASTRFTSNERHMNNLLRVSRIMKDLQSLAMSFRMVSLKQTFQKINRIGHDTIVGLKKNVNIRMSGEETEIDRGVAEKILEPLLHLVKNSISHGIESEEKDRTSKGKPAQGHVNIHAYSNRGNIYIEISDDGRGIDIDKVYKKAVERKLVDPSANYSDEEITDFIFLPGFSTADTVDNVSGRGVGLDVVKTNMSRIGGRVEVMSRPGEGCTFTLKIPINLAVINGTIVDIMGCQYVIPTINIKKIFIPDESNWISIKGKKTTVRIRDDIIPVIPLEEIFGDIEFKPDMIVVLELEQKFKALPVNGISGRQEIVVKSLGQEFSGLSYASGASILGNGRVSLILDIESLFKIDYEDGS